MEKYYIMIDGQQQGPFTKQEIINNSFSPESYIYSKSLGGWKKISEIPDFYHKIDVPPTYIPSPPTNIPSPPPNNPTSQPKTWLLESILATLFCCLPLGIVGIVNAAKVETRYKAGDYAGAIEASENAKNWINWSLGVGIIVMIIYFIAGLASSGAF